MLASPIALPSQRLTKQFKHQPFRFAPALPIQIKTAVGRRSEPDGTLSRECIRRSGSAIGYIETDPFCPRAIWHAAPQRREYHAMCKIRLKRSVSFAKINRGCGPLPEAWLPVRFDSDTLITHSFRAVRSVVS